jgi:hypothetical protein
MDNIKGHVTMEINDFLELKKASSYGSEGYEKIKNSLGNGLDTLVRSLNILLRANGEVRPINISEFNSVSLIEDIVENDMVLHIVLVPSEKDSSLKLIIQTGPKESK